ncbi:hypothetical protein [Thalassospira mesophila]|uniref:Uncharacterized protein n=1 Tax=Thalassospira mesophila TaxID=1293891 RepID=A0A1Y2L3F4_9PROT|nr:hypothetical protein [Thalassospira mesophila]OSQ38823.1 hypothetical protein TMES_08580 [Thalassospira mesophila]
MIDDGPIPPLLRQINTALMQFRPATPLPSGVTAGGRPDDFADMLALFRSAMLLWGAQNALLSGDASVSRDWMAERLDAVSAELDGILARLDTLGGNVRPDGRGATGATGTTAPDEGAASSDEDDNFELIDFVRHLHSYRSK